MGWTTFFSSLGRTIFGAANRAWLRSTAADYLILGIGTSRTSDRAGDHGNVHFQTRFFAFATTVLMAAWARSSAIGGH